ncbi:MAG TPA: GNAT family N-acetyltransferase [Streptosporangiaceae bacterium]
MRDNGRSPTDRIDAFCDAVPRDQARAERHGPLTLFVRAGPGWPYYARPTRGSGAVSADISADDIGAVRDRQRALGAPESFEWIDEVTPTMRAACEKAGLRVTAHPLMVLVPGERPPRDPAVDVRLIAADAPDLARMQAVQMIAFGTPTMAPGAGDAADRDAMVPAVEAAALNLVRDRMRSGRMVLAAAFDTGFEGPVAAGGCQILLPVAEIVGLGTLPAVRRRGLGTAVTAILAEAALARRAETVFLSAADDDVARMYGRLGFVRVGTSAVASPAS